MTADANGTTTSQTAPTADTRAQRTSQESNRFVACIKKNDRDILAGASGEYIGANLNACLHISQCCDWEWDSHCSRQG